MGVAWTTSVRYMRRSSISGLSHAAKSRSTNRAAYWLAIFAVGMVFTAQSIHTLVSDFYEHPVVVSTYVTTRPNVTFPAITVCNLNRCYLTTFAMIGQHYFLHFLCMNAGCIAPSWKRTFLL